MEYNLGRAHGSVVIDADTRGLAKAQADINALRSSLKDGKFTIDIANKGLAKAKRDLGSLMRYVRDHDMVIDVQTKNIDRTQSALRDLRGSVRNANMKIDVDYSSVLRAITAVRALNNSVRNLSSTVTVTQKTYNKTLYDMDRQSRGFANTVRRSFSDVASTIGSGMRSVVRMIDDDVKLIMAIVLALAPVLGAALSAALVSAFGIGLGALGMYAAYKFSEGSRAVREEMLDLGVFTQNWLGRVSVPFEKTWFDMADAAREAMTGIEPNMKRAMERIAPIFSGAFDKMSEAIVRNRDVVDKGSVAFERLGKAFGPKFDELIDNIFDAMGDLFDLVADNPDVFAQLIKDIGELVTLAFELVTWLGKVYTEYQKLVDEDERFEKSKGLDRWIGKFNKFLESLDKNTGLDWESLFGDFTAEDVGDLFEDAIKGLDDILEEIFMAIVQSAADVFWNVPSEAISDFFVSCYNAVIDGWNWLMDKVHGENAKHADKIGAGLGDALGGAPDFTGGPGGGGGGGDITRNIKFNIDYTSFNTQWAAFMTYFNEQWAIFQTNMATKLTAMRLSWDSSWNLMFTSNRTRWQLFNVEQIAAMMALVTLFNTYLPLIRNAWNNQWNSMFNSSQARMAAFRLWMQTSILGLSASMLNSLATLRVSWLAQWGLFFSTPQSRMSAFRANMVAQQHSLNASMLAAVASLTASYVSRHTAMFNQVRAQHRSFNSFAATSANQYKTNVMGWVAQLDRDWNGRTSSMLNGIRAKFNSFRAWAFNFYDGFVRGIVSRLQRLPNQVIAIFRGMAYNLGRQMPTMWQSVGWAAVQGFIRGMNDRMSWVRTTAWNMAVAALNAAYRALGIASPSKEFYDVGVWIGLGWIKGLDKVNKQVQEAVGSMATDTTYNAVVGASASNMAYGRMAKNGRSGQQQTQAAGTNINTTVYAPQNMSPDEVADKVESRFESALGFSGGF